MADTTVKLACDCVTCVVKAKWAKVTAVAKSVGAWWVK